jgi:hypothetical protein
MADRVDVRDGDIVLVQRVEMFYARVERAGPRDVVIQPLDPRIVDRRVRLTEIRRVFRDVGVPGLAPSQLRPGPRQLRLDGIDERAG